jgi:hypothetical protein
VVDLRRSVNAEHGRAFHGRGHFGQLVGRTVEAADLREGQRQHDQHPQEHHEPLEHVGPHDGPKAAVGCVEDHRAGERQQAQQIARLHAAEKPGAFDPAAEPAPAGLKQRHVVQKRAQQ